MAVTAWRSGSLSVDRHRPLLDAIAAAGVTDVAPWAVYADLLQTEDDPRGELMSLMLERERRPSMKLLELQRRRFAVNAGMLMPRLLDPKHVIGWRRGFASELRLDAPEQLADVATDPSLRFVEAATLVLEDNRSWKKPLAAARMSWRRLRIESATRMLKLAPIVAACPDLERLEIAAGKVDWSDVCANRLTMLVVDGGPELGSLDDAQLPKLVELRSLGDARIGDDLRSSVCWSRLERVVVSEPDAAFADDDDGDARGPTVQVCASLTPTEDEDDDDGYGEPDRPRLPTTIAVVVIGRRIDAALLRKLASRLSIEKLSARIATVHSSTVLQLFGTANAELLPYGLAIALQNVLPDRPPIALAELDGNRAARYLALGDAPLREHGRPDETIARALDVVLGYHPGTSVLQDLLVELAATPIVPLVGTGATYPLTMIDPSTAPLVDVDDDQQEYDDDDDEEEDDEYESWDEGESDFTTMYAEPPLVIEDAVEERAAAAAAPEGVVEEPVEHVELDLERLAARLSEDVEDALVPPPDRPELWFEFEEHWGERAVDIDDEPEHARWPDPERVANDYPHDLERRVAVPTCGRHQRHLEDCTSCDALHCSECGGEDYCPSCVAALLDPLLVQRAAVLVSSSQNSK